METQLIRTKGASNDRTIAVTVFGGLAVGRTWSDDGADGWNVTQVGTGLRIGPPNIYLRKEACRLAAELNSRADWDFSAEAWDSIGPDRKNELSSLACKAIALICADKGRPEPPYWEGLADMMPGKLVGYEDNCLYVADVGPDGIVRGFSGYYHEHASLEDNYYLCDGNWVHEVLGYSRGMRGADLPAEPRGLTPELADSLAEAYVTESLSYCESCEESGDSENYSINWTCVNSCTLYCGSCYENACNSGELCKGCAHDMTDCERGPECGAEACDECGAEGPIFGACDECGAEVPIPEPRSPGAPAPRAHSGAEFQGMTHEEVKATLDARISTVLAEYNPSLPVYQAV